MSSERLPRHVAIIMDGNGRWAQARGLERIKGHEEGARSVREIVRACREKGIEALTLYSFSTENWRRPAAEVTALMQLLHRYVREERQELLDQQIRLNVIGQVNRLPIFVRRPLKKLCTDTVRNPKMTLTLALSYGSRTEIVDAVRDLARRVADKKLRPEQIDESLFSDSLQTAGLPDPDLLIRTSGERRLSNFLLWQLAYAELYITDLAWPEFRRPQLDEALADFAQRERRFGRTTAQLTREPNDA